MFMKVAVVSEWLGVYAGAEKVRGLDKENHEEYFFESQTVDSVVNAVKRFEQERYKTTAENCRKNAEKFSTNNFSRDFGAFVSKIICT